LFINVEYIITIYSLGVFTFILYETFENYLNLVSLVLKIFLINQELIYVIITMSEKVTIQAM